MKMMVIMMMFTHDNNDAYEFMIFKEELGYDSMRCNKREAGTRRNICRKHILTICNSASMEYVDW